MHWFVFEIKIAWCEKGRVIEYGEWVGLYLDGCFDGGTA
jgi:hypothetical protein